MRPASKCYAHITGLELSSDFLIMLMVHIHVFFSDCHNTAPVFVVHLLLSSELQITFTSWFVPPPCAPDCLFTLCWTIQPSICPWTGTCFRSALCLPQVVKSANLSMWFCLNYTITGFWILSPPYYLTMWYLTFAVVSGFSGHCISALSTQLTCLPETWLLDLDFCLYQPGLLLSTCPQPLPASGFFIRYYNSNRGPSVLLAPLWSVCHFHQQR